MEKIIHYSDLPKRIQLQCLRTIDMGNHTKVAAVMKESISKEIQDYVKALKPDQENIYVLATPLGASEYYGANNNGDYFSEEALNPKEPNANWGYKTFETTPARIYHKHANKDPENSMGEVVKSAYNTNMHRVEVIVKLNKEKAPEVVEKIERAEEKRAAGEDNEAMGVGISMGCKLVDGDVCSICGHRSRNRLEYCECLREKLGQVLPDGRKVVAYNPKPIFFDLSIVDNPAAREAAVLKKVAHQVTKLSKDITNQEIRFYDEYPIVNKAKGIIKNLSNTEEVFSTQVLSKLASEELLPMINTTASLGIVLKPEEFQYIALTKGGYSALAKQYSSSNLVFRPSTLSKKLPGTDDDSFLTYDEKIASLIKDKYRSRSGFEPYLSLRLLNIEKRAENKNKKYFENPLLSEISNIYNGYREYIINSMTHYKLAKTINNNPEILKMYLDTNHPEIKIASFSGLSTSEKIAEGMTSQISMLYFLLS